MQLAVKKMQIKLAAFFHAQFLNIMMEGPISAQRVELQWFIAFNVLRVLYALFAELIII